ncbi:hypothetical protein Gpo141_00014118 [Globisporangium polare]
MAQQEKFSESLDSLFPSGSNLQAECLRQKFNASLEIQFSIAKRLRNTIPDAANSDARNKLQELSDDLLTHLSKLSNQVGVITDRRIKEYSKVRILKACKRQVAVQASKKAAQASTSSAHAKEEVPGTRE